MCTLCDAQQGDGFRFKLGRLVATRGIVDKTEPEVMHGLVTRHLAKDWGDLSDHDKRENELALMNGGRLLSAYKINENLKVWIITEPVYATYDAEDHEDTGCPITTTILLPEEY